MALNKLKLLCENCGNKWEIELERDWQASKNSYGVCLFPSTKIKHNNPLTDSIVLRCSKCNQCRKIVLDK